MLSSPDKPRNPARSTAPAPPPTWRPGNLPPSSNHRAMAVRIGVDVGGTFTKAVGIDMATGDVAARAAVMTTHDDAAGSAAGVVQVVHAVADAVGADAV